MGDPAAPQVHQRTFLALGIALVAALPPDFERGIRVPLAEAVFVWFVLNALQAPPQEATVRPSFAVRARPAPVDLTSATIAIVRRLSAMFLAP